MGVTVRLIPRLLMLMVTGPIGMERDGMPADKLSLVPPILICFLNLNFAI